MGHPNTHYRFDYLDALYHFILCKKHKISLTEKFWTGFGIGYVTDLLDTLGVGTFATTTTMFKLTKLVEDDRRIPATMTTGSYYPGLSRSLAFYNNCRG